MPNYDTPDPIGVTIQITGDATVTASDREDTVVEVRPRNEAKAGDRRAAAETVVELTDGRLRVITPKHWTRFTPFGGGEFVDVTVEVPTGSQLDADTGMGRLRTEGELGECRLKSGMGNLRVDHCAELRATTGHGDVFVDDVTGDAELRTGSGHVRVGRVGGATTVKSSNGDCLLGESVGPAQVRTANGGIEIGVAHGSATARTANGDVRIHDVRSGVVVLETAAGELEIGVHEGVSAWLDLQSRYGMVRNSLDQTDGPGPDGGTVEVRATTSVGDVLVGRAVPGRGVPA
jgi:Putative adhesin